MRSRPMARVVRLLILGATLAGTAGGPAAEAQDRRLVPTGTADGGKRLAFVVGNDTYQQAPLKNARNDARVMAGVLRELGFEVTAIEDASRSAFGAALEGWARGLGSSDLAVVYYAGHGVELEGQNYLVPVDYAGVDAAMVKWEAVPAERIHEILQRVRVGVLVLDACRNNPFAGKRGAGGLAAMEARGTLIAYATGAGQTASDNPAGTNGLFTQELAKVLRQPGLSLTEAFRAVRKAVYDATSGQQFPAVYDGLLGDVVLRPAIAEPPRSAPPPAAVPAPPPAMPTLRQRATQVALLWEAGMAASKRGDTTGAIAKFNEANAVSPGCWDCHYNLAFLYGQVGDANQAMIHFLKVLELKPDHPEADTLHYHVGVLLWNQGDYKGARSQFLSAVSIRPSYADAHYQIGMTWLNDGNTAQAATYFRKYLELAPNGEWAKNARAILQQIRQGGGRP